MSCLLHEIISYREPLHFLDIRTICNMSVSCTTIHIEQIMVNCIDLYHGLHVLAGEPGEDSTIQDEREQEYRVHFNPMHDLLDGEQDSTSQDGREQEYRVHFNPMHDLLDGEYTTTTNISETSPTTDPEPDPEPDPDA
jgi:hypothetical protein